MAHFEVVDPMKGAMKHEHHHHACKN